MNAAELAEMAANVRNIAAEYSVPAAAGAPVAGPGAAGSGVKPATKPPTPGQIAAKEKLNRMEMQARAAAEAEARGAVPMDLGAVGGIARPPPAEPPVNLMTPEEWGRHLRADYRHDGLFPTIPYNINGAGAVKPSGTEGGRTKEYCDQEFLDDMETFQNRSTFQNLRKSVVRFTFSEKTGNFEPIPKFFPLGNRGVAIVMDAGANITGELNLINAITFGMCIDAASSPIGPERNPVYYDPGVGNRHVYIDLGQFGFDPTVIHGIWIVDVLGNGSEVKSAWVVGPRFPGDGGDYRVWDPMRERFTGLILTGANFREFGSIPQDVIDGLKAKEINVLDGAYSGKNSAVDLGKQIGKTMGDTMIVASAMKAFTDGTQNPFYGGVPANWKIFRTDTAMDPPQPTVLIVKTGDLLNAARAIAVRVPVILERYGGDNTLRKFDFWPGQVQAETILNGFRDSYTDMVATLRARYDALVTEFRGITDSPGSRDTIKLQSGITRFMDDARYPFRNNKRHFAKAGQLVFDICQSLERLRDDVAGYFAERGGAMVTAKDDGVAVDVLINQYNKDLKDLNDLCPQSSKIRDSKSRLFPIIVVTRVSDPGITLVPGRVVKGIEIRLGSAFQAITETIAEQDPEYGGTAFSRYFTERLPALGGVGGARDDGGGAAAGPDNTDLDDYIESVVACREPISEEEATRRADLEGGKRHQRGGVDGDGGAAAAGDGPPAGDEDSPSIFEGFTDGRESISAKTVPLIDRFITYYESRMGPSLQKSGIFNVILDLFRVRESYCIADPVLLERMKLELDYLKSLGILSYPDEIAPKDQKESTIATLVYNAFTASINKGNSVVEEGYRDPGFGYIEEKFIESALEMISRTDEFRDILSGTGAPSGAPTQEADEAAVMGDSAPFSVATATPPYARGAALNTRDMFAMIRKLVEAKRVWTKIAPNGSPRGSVQVAAESPILSVASTPFARGRQGTGAPRDDQGTTNLATRASRALAQEFARAFGGGRTPRRKNRKSTYRLKKKPSK